MLGVASATSGKQRWILELDPNELLYKQKQLYNIAKPVIVTKRDRWCTVRNELVEMNVHTLLFEIINEDP